MKLVLGSLFAVFLLMIVPSISAIEYQTVVEENKVQLLEKIGDIKKEENHNNDLLEILLWIIIRAFIFPIWVFERILVRLEILPPWGFGGMP